MVFFWAQVGVSVLLVLLVILHPPQRTGDSSALKVQLLNPTDSPVALCWLSSYAREDELIQKSPEGCYRIGQGERNKFTLNTFTGHRFIVLPWDKNDKESTPDDKSVVKKDVTKPPVIFLYMKPNMTFYTLNFKPPLAVLEEIESFDDAWQQLLRHRHYFVIFIVSLFLLFLQFMSRNSNQRRPKALIKDVPEVNLIIHRHSLKAIAVVNMVVNHISYMIVQDNPELQLLGTIPADIIGSAQIFWFLVGFHPTPSLHNSLRSQSSTILVVFLLLEHFCRLPKPLTYETLFTIVLARYIFTSQLFEYDTKTNGCSFASLPILVHCLCCCALIAVNEVFNANGLRLFQCTGLLYAMSGKLLCSCQKGSSKHARVAQFLWLFAAWCFQLSVVWKAKLVTLDFWSREGIAACVCLLGALYQGYVFAFPAQKALWTPSRCEVLLSRYSLEIYCLHLMILWYFYGS